MIMEGSDVHRTHSWRESIDEILLQQANMDAIARRLVSNKPYRTLANQTADPNIALKIYTDGYQTKQGCGFDFRS